MDQSARATRRNDDYSRIPPWIRPLCAEILLSAIEEINFCLEQDAKLDGPKDPRMCWRRPLALGACHWILSDDNDDPLSYLAVCDFLNLPAERLRRRVVKIDAYLHSNGIAPDGNPLAAPEPLQPTVQPGPMTEPSPVNPCPPAVL